jgi:hypothetical protein
VHLLDRATRSSGKQARVLVKRARTALKQAGTKAIEATKRKKRQLSSDCATTLKAVADRVIGGLGV